MATVRQDLGLAGALLRARLYMVLNSILHLDPKRRLAAAVLALLVCSYVLSSYSFAGVIVGISNPTGSVIYAAIGGILTLLVGFTAVTSVTFSLSSLYFAKDLAMLHSSPLRPRVIILARLLTQLALGGSLGAIITGPAVVAYLLSEGSLWSLPLVLLTALTLAAIPMTIATAVTVFALRIVPARYARDAGAIFVTVAVVAVAAVNLAIRGPAALAKTSLSSIHLAKTVSPWVGWPFSPINWATRAIYDLSRGSWMSGLAWTLLLAIVAAVSLIVVVWCCGSAYLRGLQNAMSASGGRRPPQKRKLGLGTWRRSLWQLIVFKDLAEIRRDAAQLGQLLLPMVLFALYIGAPGHSSDFAASGLPAWYGASLTAAFASMFVASGVALRGIGTEGMKLWILLSAPISTRTLLLGKYIVGMVLALVLAVALLWVGIMRSPQAVLPALLPTVRLAVIVAGLVGLAAGMGALWPRLDWTDPRRAVGIGTTLSFLGLGSAYLCVVFVVLGIPYVFHGQTALLVWISDILVLGIAAGTSALAMGLGARRLAAMQV